MRETFRPRWATSSPMYYDNPDSPIWNDSPVPLRHYVHIGGNSLRLYPFSNLLRSRDQATWNLLWLTSPVVDEALQVHNNERFDAFLDLTRPWLFHRYHACKKLTQETVKWGGRTCKVGDVAKAVHPQEFTEFMLRHPRFLKALSVGVSKDAPEHMQHRAQVHDRIEVENLNVGPNQPDRILPIREASKAVLRTHQQRETWLNQASELLKPHIEAAGFAYPRFHVRMDKHTFSRFGVCAISGHDKETDELIYEIGISPMYVDQASMLNTLVHEIAHAVVCTSVGHTKPFWDACNQLGLIGKWHGKPNAELRAQYDQINQSLGPYPGLNLHLRIP
jgi:hypothetical protein